MKPLTQNDILSIEDFKAQRPRLEREVIRVKDQRTLALGPFMTILFENSTTVKWQVQEMCRVETIRAPEAVQHELDTYNALLPGPSELSATLLVEIDDPVTRKRMLTDLSGLHQHVRLEVEGAAPAIARFDEEQFDGTRISTVQFVRVPLDAEQRQALFDLGRPASIVIDHPAYRVTTALPPSLRGALLEDLMQA